jgi:hypothetical protein
MLRGFFLGEDNQALPIQTRMFSNATAQALATSLGTTVPDQTTGWVMLDFYQLNTTGATGMSVFKEPGLSLRSTEGVTVETVPPAPRPALYPDVNERVSASADAGLRASSLAGTGLLVGLPGGEYEFQFSHPTLDCGFPYWTIVPPGWVISNIGAVCGPGTR